MKKQIKISFTVLSFVLLTACHKGDGNPGNVQCVINQRCEMLEGQAAEITDTSKLVLNNQTNKYEHPVYVTRFERVISDNREWGNVCVYADFGRIITQVSLQSGSQVVTDTFSYDECINRDLPISQNSRKIQLDNAKLYMLRTRPVIQNGSYEKEDHPYSVEMILKN